MENKQQLGSIVNSNVSAINVNKQERKKQIMNDNYFYLKIFIVLVLCVIVFWIIAVLVHNCYSFNVDINHIVITFVGIIAAFVVISNYFQVSSIEKRMEFKINEFGDVIRNITQHVERLDSKISDFENTIHKINQHTELLQEKINNINVRIEKKINSDNEPVGLSCAGLNPIGFNPMGQHNEFLKSLEKTTKIIEDIQSPLKKVAKLCNAGKLNIFPQK
jgi:hypothetical protein